MTKARVNADNASIDDKPYDWNEETQSWVESVTE